MNVTEDQFQKLRQLTAAVDMGTIYLAQCEETLRNARRAKTDAQAKLLADTAALRGYVDRLMDPLGKPGMVAVGANPTDRKSN